MMIWRELSIKPFTCMVAMDGANIPLNYGSEQNFSSTISRTLHEMVPTLGSDCSCILMQELRQGLIKNKSKLFYQPKVSLETGRMTGMEALIGWYNYEKGLASPANFIPIAEDTEIITPMGTWVLTEACSQTKAWHYLGFDNLEIVANLSVIKFRNKSLLKPPQKGFANQALLLVSSI